LMKQSFWAWWSLMSCTSESSMLQVSAPHLRQLK